MLDADALNVIAEPENGLIDLVRNRKGQTIITPHPGEAGRLLQMPEITGVTDRVRRMDFGKKLAEMTGAVAVLKGADTIVATPGGDSYTNTTGNPGMATGGSGDVLTGMIAGLWGQKQACEDGGLRRIAAWEAAVCGVFLHGLAGDLAAEVLGEYGMIAGDIAEKIPFAIRQILERKPEGRER